MIDYNDPVYVEWDRALEAVQAAHHSLRRRLDKPEEREEARTALDNARRLYDAALERVP
ncbi:hypothetical protein [Brevundimonas sp. GCM10030266]|uniref:hypothetical protein n=1 Tax=Brevundimonas sp. GCM10030266 TaxID=3273386 RepID=UPI0036107867